MILHKGYIVRVGSGFSIEQRKEFYQDPNKILGKIIEVQYFEETKNQDGGLSLRFPTFKYLYGDSRDT
jgi:DNA ligase-1